MTINIFFLLKIEIYTNSKIKHTIMYLLPVIYYVYVPAHWYFLNRFFTSFLNFVSLAVSTIGFIKYVGKYSLWRDKMIRSLCPELSDDWRVKIIARGVYITMTTRVMKKNIRLMFLYVLHLIFVISEHAVCFDDKRPGADACKSDGQIYTQIRPFIFRRFPIDFGGTISFCSRCLSFLARLDILLIDLPQRKIIAIANNARKKFTKTKLQNEKYDKSSKYG